jgi:hypothetical protein
MAHKKALKRITKILDKIWQEGYDDGYSDGWDNALEVYGNNNDDQENFEQGVQAERARINSILDMKIQDSLDMNRGSHAVFYRNTKQLLNIQIDLSEPLPEDDDF